MYDNNIITIYVLEIYWAKPPGYQSWCPRLTIMVKPLNIKYHLVQHLLALFQYVNVPNIRESKLSLLVISKTTNK